MNQILTSSLMIALLPLGMATKQTQNISDIVTQSTPNTCEATQSVVSSEDIVEVQKPVYKLQKQAVKFVPTPSSAELDTLFEQAATTYGVSVDTLKIIANCESRFNPQALSKSGSYAGLFQFSKSTWVSNRRAMGLDENPDLRFDAKQAIDTGAFKISRDGVGAWPVCGKKTF